MWGRRSPRASICRWTRSWTGGCERKVPVDPARGRTIGGACSFHLSLPRWTLCPCRARSDSLGAVPLGVPGLPVRRASAGLKPSHSFPSDTTQLTRGCQPARVAPSTRATARAHAGGGTWRDRIARDVGGWTVLFCTELARASPWPQDGRKVGHQIVERRPRYSRKP